MKYTETVKLALECFVLDLDDARCDCLGNPEPRNRPTTREALTFGVLSEIDAQLGESAPI